MNRPVAPRPEPRVLVVTAMLPTPADPVRGIVVRREIDRLRDQGVPVVEIGKTPGSWGYLRQAAEIVRAVRRGQVDLIHAHYGTTGFVAALCAPRTPLVITMHGSDLAHGPRPGLSRYWVQYLLSIAGATRAQRVLVQDETMMDTVPAWLRRRTEVLGQAVVPVAAPRSRGGAREDGDRVLFLSDRARPVKRFWLAQRAVELVTSSQVVLRSLDEYTPDRVVDAMVGARLGLLTSEREGMPVAVKEALACGLPVVATDLPPLRPLAQALPFAVALADGTAQDLAQAVTEALARPPLDPGQRGAIDAYLASHGWVEPERTLRLTNLYRQVQAGGRRGRRS